MLHNYFILFNIKIKLVNNKINKGTFITRNLRALYAKGKY